MTKIKCPFNLPLKVVPYYLGDNDWVAIMGSDDAMFGACSKEEGNYIIRAVNNFEKLREALRPFADLGNPMLKHGKYDDSIWATCPDFTAVRHIPDYANLTFGTFRRAAGE